MEVLEVAKDLAFWTKSSSCTDPNQCDSRGALEPQIFFSKILSALRMGSASLWIQTLLVTTEWGDMKCLMKSFCDGHQSSFGSIASGIARASMLGKCSYYFSTFINHLQVLVPTFCSNFLSNFFFLFSPPPPCCFGCPRKLPLPWVAMEKIHQAMSLRVDNSFAVSLAGAKLPQPSPLPSFSFPVASLGVVQRKPWMVRNWYKFQHLERSKQCHIDIQL